MRLYSSLLSQCKTINGPTNRLLQRTSAFVKFHKELKPLKMESSSGLRHLRTSYTNARIQLLRTVCKTLCKLQQMTEPLQLRLMEQTRIGKIHSQMTMRKHPFAHLTQTLNSPAPRSSASLNEKWLQMIPRISLSNLRAPPWMTIWSSTLAEHFLGSTSREAQAKSSP